MKQHPLVALVLMLLLLSSCTPTPLTQPTPSPNVTQSQTFTTTTLPAQTPNPTPTLTAGPATTSLSVLAAPTLKSPFNDSMASSLTPTLEWQASTKDVFYGLQVATDRGFSNLIIEERGLQEASYVVPASKLSYGKTYYWRVGVGNTGGKSGWSQSWSFLAPSIPTTNPTSTSTPTRPSLNLTETQGGVETNHIIVRNMTGQLSSERVKQVAIAAEEALVQILDFWSIQPGLEEYGKILVELQEPIQSPKFGEFYSAEFFFRKKDNSVYRAVPVQGAVKEPQHMVHKLLHAVLFNPDKLIRNMIGINMEVQFGNYLTFPNCGFSNDAWVLALRQTNVYIPLAQLGPDNESWGMTFQGETVTVTDLNKQQTAYAEAGSLGQYLLKTYGVQKVKAFQELSLQKERPWVEVFGLTMNQLETNWIQALKANEQEVLVLVELIRRYGAGVARFEAQRLQSKD